jgi:hypothetical protein
MSVSWTCVGWMKAVILLFAGLSPYERRILYLRFAGGRTWKIIAKICRKGIKTVQEDYCAILDKLRNKGEIAPVFPDLDSMGRPHLALKALEVVADSHGKGQQFFERLLRLVEGQADPAGLQVDTRRKVDELLGQDLKRGLDEKLGAFESVLLQLRQDFGNVSPSPPLVVAVVALGDAAQTGDESIPIGQTVGADTLGNAGSEDLLGAAAADAEEEFEGRAVNERPG